MIRVPCKRGALYQPATEETYPLLSLEKRGLFCPTPEETHPLLDRLDRRERDAVLTMMNGSGSSGHNKPPTGRGANMSETRAKNVLIEAVDAVVNSFAKHTYGYGRGRSNMYFV